MVVAKNFLIASGITARLCSDEFLQLSDLGQNRFEGSPAPHIFQTCFKRSQHCFRYCFSGLGRNFASQSFDGRIFYIQSHG